MFLKQILFLSILSVSVIAHGGMISQPECSANKKGCQDLNSPCQCYCSVKCGPRLKKSDDKPVYVENDPEGHYCYCKQWDLDNYKTKCKYRSQK